jgi:hypothetical protein
MDWQSIETAPMEGQPVLCAFYFPRKRGEPTIGLCVFDDGQWWWVPHRKPGDDVRARSTTAIHPLKWLPVAWPTDTD